MYDITTIDDLIQALGGPSALAIELGISQPAVSQWAMRGHIPRGWHMLLLARAYKAGLSVDPAVMGMTEDDLGPFAIILSGPNRALHPA